MVMKICGGVGGGTCEEVEWQRSWGAGMEGWGGRGDGGGVMYLVFQTKLATG